MRLTTLSALVVVAISLMSMDAHAAPVNRKFHPVVNDDPQNAHLNVQTPGADINQTISINQAPGPDGQVIPAGDTKVAACALKDANGDIDLSGGGSCWSPKSPGPTAERASVTASTTVQAVSAAPRTASRTVRVPSLNSAAIARAINLEAPKAVPTTQAEALRSAAPLSAHRIETVRAAVSVHPATQTTPIIRARVAATESAGMRWFESGLFVFAATMLVALGIGLIIRMGLGRLLIMRRNDERTDKENAAAATVKAVLAKQ
jgi:hypothetical protein